MTDHDGYGRYALSNGKKMHVLRALRYSIAKKNTCKNDELLLKTINLEPTQGISTTEIASFMMETADIAMETIDITMETMEFNTQANGVDMDVSEVTSIHFPNSDRFELLVAVPPLDAQADQVDALQYQAAQQDAMSFLAGDFRSLRM
ncbi:hypothetical protein BGX21_000263 [Mortierella sp. AD011]|nr:hypothetical protein BGX20_000869 [Mortierella sp. AD010]KAF9401889.1 hypothetical protein BGX21_000263 [Mortierella sp. AD011]